MKKIFFLLLLLTLSCISAQGYICAVGGGSENYSSWSDKPYGWIVQKADSGKIIIITDTPASDTAWLPNYFRSLGAKVVVSKNIGSKTIADDQTTYDELVTAKGIFIRGGDQWQYWHLWSGTKTAEAIKKVFNNGGVIAGTSAGAMVLSDFVYTGTETSTVDSKDVLLNPSHPVIQLKENFLDLVPNALIDTHFIERGRFGRLIIFMLNLFTKNLKNILGVGIDDQTALCIEPNGIASVYGNGAVSFFNIDNRTRIVSTGNDFTIESLKCDQLIEHWQYDLVNRSVFSIPSSARHVSSNRQTGYSLTDIWFTGSENISQIIVTALPQFLSKYNPNKITIISGAGYETIATQIENYLDMKSVSHKLFIVSSSNLNDTNEAEKISTADALLFCGNDLTSLALLNDHNTTTGLAFWNKINPSIPIFAVGNSGKSLCGNYIDNLDTQNDASYRGRMTNNIGLSIFDDLIFQPMWFTNSSYVENRTSAMLYGLMKNRKRFGLYLNDSDYSSIISGSNNITVNGSMPVLLVDASETDYADSSKWKISGGVSTRQLVAMTNLRYSVSSFDKTFSFSSRSLLNTTKVESKYEYDKTFRLDNNYPNPFNGSTRIIFNLDKTSFVSLRIYDILGREVERIVNEVLPNGLHTYDFIPKQTLSTGVYFYKIITNDYSHTKKMIYLR